MTYPPQQPVRSTTLGTTSLVLAFVALVASTIASIVLGTHLATAQTELSPYFGDMTPEAQRWAFTLAGSQILWTVLGVSALVTGIVASAQHRGRRQGRAGALVAVLAPFISFGAFVLAAILTA